MRPVDKAPRLMRPLAHRALEDPRGLQRDMLETLPKVLFALKETGVSVLYALASIPAVLIAAIWVGSHPH